MPKRTLRLIAGGPQKRLLFQGAKLARNEITKAAFIIQLKVHPESQRQRHAYAALGFVELFARQLGLTGMVPTARLLSDGLACSGSN